MTKNTIFKTFLGLAIIFISFLFFGPTKVLAAENPLAVTNNQFGIHIQDENDLDKASFLVNSGGGDWGYVTLVIRQDERDQKRWQRSFDKMRRLHLIPIVRIATKQDGDNWTKPDMNDIDNWVNFLNSLNWVVKNRYIVIGNEPNHAQEWGGDINPKEYADWLYTFSQRLKNASQDFYVLPAGFDASAPNDREHMTEELYIMKMFDYKPNLFDYVDGWTSHSYPNPDFSAPETGVGKGSIRTYQWELELLRELGVTKDLPVFITETGWIHNLDGESGKYLDEATIADNLKSSFANVWNDPRIVAVTPFLLNYQGAPFNVFSWTKPDGSFYKFYYAVQNLPKKDGSPTQINSAQIIAVLTPEIIQRSNAKWGMTLIKNTGQSIWVVGKKILVDDNDKKIQILPMFFSDVEPGQMSVVFFTTQVKIVSYKFNLPNLLKQSEISG